MYNRTEATQRRQEFWTVFGQYMAPLRSADGERVSWLNYKTGERGVRFVLQATTETARIGIELAQADSSLQQLYFEQFAQFKNLLQQQVEEVWTWQLHSHDETGRLVSTIATECTGINILKREDWPQLISFFKPRLIAIDAFWCKVKYAFKALH